MAEKHDLIVSHYRAKLVKQKYKIEKGNPFVDYRPDIFATKGNTKLFVEVEIESTLNGDHTFNQLDIMYRYLTKSQHYKGALVVPKSKKREAGFIIDSIFGDKKIIVEPV